MLLVFWPSRGLAINVTIHDRTINMFSTTLGPEERLCPRTTGYYVVACRTSPSGGEVFLIDSKTYAIISLGLSLMIPKCALMLHVGAEREMFIDYRRPSASVTSVLPSSPCPPLWCPPHTSTPTLSQPSRC